MLPKHFSRKYNSAPCTANCVSIANCRFTILSNRLVRIEYSPKGIFEDRATQSVVNRQLGDVNYTVSADGDKTTIKTDSLEIVFDCKLGLTPQGLSIKLLNMPNTPVWHYGQEQNTLKGTYRTLDGCDVEHPVGTDIILGEGVCSRDGFAILDDSKSLAVLEDGWIDQREEEIVDIYFFGYGHDYIAATRALYALTGNPPLLPDYVFGNWWSRYYKYSETSYIDLMKRFIDEDIPFSVSVIDMDWHWSEGYGDIPWTDTWTGYSWNTNLFPDYKRFLNWLHRHNLHPALNLHPAKGIQHHEVMYPQMAKAMGIDPESGENVDFAPTNKKFWGPYFEIVHNPYEADGVVFWWMDWQQGTTTDIKGLDPLWIINHMHSLDIERGEKRPMFFSRYSGPGSQRFYIGFSGDTYIKWSVIDYEPYFTATSANIGFPYWSHDIGGFQHGERDDELYARWMQFGVFSPICRLHSTNSPFLGKEPWNYRADCQEVTKEFLRLRHKLFPYIYSMNYRTYTEQLPICQPLYYDYPEDECAYKYKNEYFFGSQMLVSPITVKADQKTTLAKNDLWLPEGIWTDFFNGCVYKGGQELTVWRNLYSMPVFCKAGSIVPMAKHTAHDNTLSGKTDLELYVFPGADNSFVMYEDEGDNKKYLDGHFAKTEFNLLWGENEATFTINPPTGDLSVIPQKRNYTVYLRGFARDMDIKVTKNGYDIQFNSSYDMVKNTTVLEIGEVSFTDRVEVMVSSGLGLVSKNENWKLRSQDILLRSQTASGIKVPCNNDVIEPSDFTVSKRLEILNTHFTEIEPQLREALEEIIKISEG